MIVFNSSVENAYSLKFFMPACISEVLRLLRALVSLTRCVPKGVCAEVPKVMNDLKVLNPFSSSLSATLAATKVNYPLLISALSVNQISYAAKLSLKRVVVVNGANGRS